MCYPLVCCKKQKHGPGSARCARATPLHGPATAQRAHTDGPSTLACHLQIHRTTARKHQDSHAKALHCTPAHAPTSQNCTHIHQHKLQAFTQHPCSEPTSRRSTHTSCPATSPVRISKPVRPARSATTSLPSPLAASLPCAAVSPETALWRKRCRALRGGGRADLSLIRGRIVQILSTIANTADNCRYCPQLQILSKIHKIYCPPYCPNKVPRSHVIIENVNPSA